MTRYVISASIRAAGNFADVALPNRRSGVQAAIDRLVRWLLPLTIPLLLAAVSFGTPLPGPISIHTSCTWTAANVVGAYSGPLSIVAWQFGVIVVNVESGAQSFSSGVWKPMLGGCSGRSDLSFVGDCWQTVISLTASNGSPKWLVTPGAPVLCHKDGLMVWKWSAALQKYETVGLAAPPSGSSTFRLGTAVLDGDTGWLPLTHDKWSPCDLNTLVCGAAVDSPPAGEGRQQGVGGYSYNVGVDFAHPNENGGPVWFWIARSDQPTPTRPPANTPTVTPTGATPTRTPTRDQSCYAFGSANTCTPTPRLSRTATPTRIATPGTTRWSVNVAWASPTASGVGVPFCTTTAPTSYSSNFWFFEQGRTEIVVNVLDGCGVNGNYWFFAAGLTNVGVTINLHDNVTGRNFTYPNVQGTAFPTIQNTAFERCGP